MVYKILYKDITGISQQSTHIIAISANGEFALINSSNELSEEVIDEASINTIMNSEEWKQPCINC